MHKLHIPSWGLTIKTREKLWIVIDIKDNGEEKEVYLGIAPALSKEDALLQAYYDIGEVSSHRAAFDLLSLISQAYSMVEVSSIIDGLMDNK